MLQVYEQAKSECNYNATRFRNMVVDQGGLQAAKSLLNSGGYSEGLTRLWEEGSLGISMEGGTNSLNAGVAGSILLYSLLTRGSVST